MQGGLRTGLVAIGGAAWILSSVAHWTTHGNGSTMNGLRLSGWLRTSPFRPSWGPWGSGAILFIAFAGCALLATCTLASPAVGTTRLVLAGVVLVTLIALAALGRFPLRRWDTAPWLVAGGAVLVLSTLRPRTAPTRGASA